MSEPEDLRSREQRLVDARRRVYMADATDADHAELHRLEAESAMEAGPAAAEPPPAILPTTATEVAPRQHRRARHGVVIGSGAVGVALVVAAGAVVVGQSRDARRQEPFPEATVQADAQISLRQLLTRFSSSLPSEWQGAAIVTERPHETSAISLPITSSATAKHHFLVVRCPSDDGRWTVRGQGQGRWTSVTGPCGALGFAPLPVGIEAVRVRVGGVRPFAVAVLAHR